MSSVEKCPCCGAKEAWTKFSEETQEFGPTSSHFSVDDLSGGRCLKCGEELFSPESNKKIVTAINDANRKKNADFVKNVRKNKIGITQGEAVERQQTAVDSSSIGEVVGEVLDVSLDCLASAGSATVDVACVVGSCVGNVAVGTVEVAGSIIGGAFELLGSISSD